MIRNFPPTPHLFPFPTAPPPLLPVWLAVWKTAFDFFFFSRQWREASDCWDLWLQMQVWCVKVSGWPAADGDGYICPHGFSAFLAHCTEAAPHPHITGQLLWQMDAALTLLKHLGGSWRGVTEQQLVHVSSIWVYSSGFQPHATQQQLLHYPGQNAQL